MPRAFLIVIDSVGIGGAPDADQFFNDGTPDTGANTVGHIAQACAAGTADNDTRQGMLRLPVMDGLGLGAALRAASPDDAPGLSATPQGAFAAATEQSAGKDTPTGHWELTGAPLTWDWHTFPDKTPAFPDDLVAEICALAGTDGILGNCHASGTQIIEDMGEEHIRSGWPIVYTSVDSVLQIAAHETHFGLDRLLDLCAALAPRLHAMRVGRVIARPFVGTDRASFTRTPNRKDYALEPPRPTLCDWVHDAGHKVHSVGKIADIFSMRGIDTKVKGRDVDLMVALHDHMDSAEDGALIFANLVEFDSLYGHRRDPAGYAQHLEWFDAELGKMIASARPDDLIVITADHGNDPTWVGGDHTRERVPVLIHGAGARDLGVIDFVDVGATIAGWLGVANDGPGKALL